MNSKKTFSNKVDLVLTLILTMYAVIFGVYYFVDKAKKAGFNHETTDLSSLSSFQRHIRQVYSSNVYQGEIDDGEFKVVIDEFQYDDNSCSREVLLWRIGFKKHISPYFMYAYDEGCDGVYEWISQSARLETHEYLDYLSQAIEVVLNPSHQTGGTLHPPTPTN